MGSEADVIDLDDHRPIWASGPEICGLCGHRTIGTYPAAHPAWKPWGGECSKCGQMAVVALHEAYPDREVLPR